MKEKTLKALNDFTVISSALDGVIKSNTSFILGHFSK